jgi:hypothetical protein
VARRFNHVFASKISKMAKFFENFKKEKIPKTIDCVDCAIEKSIRKLFDAATCEAPSHKTSWW